MGRPRKNADSAYKPSKEIVGIRELFASKAAKAPAKSGKVVKNDFDKFTDTIDATIADMRKFKDTGVTGNPKGWYKTSDDGSVTFKVGRMALDIAGSKSFEATNIEDAIYLLEHSKKLVLEDEEVRSQITAYYAKFADRKKK